MGTLGTKNGYNFEGSNILYKKTKDIARIIVCLGDYAINLYRSEDKREEFVRNTLEKYLMTLSVYDLCVLESVMWLGRDEFCYVDVPKNPENYFKNGFFDAYSTAKESNKKSIVDYIAGKIELSRYLEFGYKLLGESLDKYDD